MTIKDFQDRYNKLKLETVESLNYTVKALSNNSSDDHEMTVKSVINVTIRLSDLCFTGFLLNLINAI